MQRAIQAAILGTQRRAIDQELEKILTQLGIEREAATAERLLEGVSLLERLARSELPRPLVLNDSFTAIPKEKGEWPSPRAARALQLTLGDSYRLALPEILMYMEKASLLVPPHLLTSCLEIALAAQKADQTIFATQLFRLCGERGRWLAGQHPEWQELLPPSNWQEEFLRLGTPSQRATLLRRWREVEPNAAREALTEIWAPLFPKQQETLLPSLMVGLSSADTLFLKQALVPKRKQVRRTATKLLLSIPDSDAYQELVALAKTWLKVEGQSIAFQPHKMDLPVLDVYGLSDTKSSPESALLTHLPPQVWAGLTALKPAALLRSLSVAGQHLLQVLLRAIIHYRDPVWRLAFLQYLVRENRPQSELSKLTIKLYEQITPSEYQQLTDWAVKNVEQVFRPGSVLRTISLQVAHPWPDIFSKLVVEEFTTQLSYGRRSY
ncbi:MAG: DUF5691 domain-containing protein, partial [Bacteroidota bacterium]